MDPSSYKAEVEYLLQIRFIDILFLEPKLRILSPLPGPPHMDDLLSMSLFNFLDDFIDGPNVELHF